MTLALEVETEDVPAAKKHMISTRANSEYKWQAKHVVGALEVPSQPDLKVRLKYTKRQVKGYEDKFQRFLTTVWKSKKLRDEFVQACENAPVETCCCGILTDNDKTIKRLTPQLNEGWVKKTNEKILSLGQPFRVDAFVWSWNNATGKSETNILLLRVFEIPPHQQHHNDDNNDNHNKDATEKSK